MIEYNFRKGDMIIAKDGARTNVGIFTKQTRGYWDYYFNGQECRIKKDKLWGWVDLYLDKKVKVQYGSDMKRRRKQIKGRTLDLHGTAHKDVDEKVRRFFNFAVPPLYVVTGDSSRMQKMVRGLVEEYGWSCYNDSNNYGKLIVLDTNDTQAGK